MKTNRILRPILVLLALTFGLNGCRSTYLESDYGRPLPPGAYGLRRITDPARMPDLSAVVRQLNDPTFRDAVRRSVHWFTYPSAPRFFAQGPISHVHAQASAYALSKLAEQSAVTTEQLTEQFDVWESVGWDGSGAVLYTGYYSPVFSASRTRSAEYRYPIYARPPDLVTDPVTGQVLSAFPTRAEIERSSMLAGLELVYLSDPLDVYLIQVNGSAKLNLVDRAPFGVLYVGYAGTNGHEYTSISRLLVEDGKLDADRVSLPAIRAYFRDHPDDLDQYILQNDRFVFFREYDGGTWPAGSMGFRVTPMRSLATDKSIFPRGSVVLVQTTVPTGSGGFRTFDQLMVDQDTGGAIRAAGRADIYSGIGPEAEHLAGRQVAEGRLYYLLLKPHQVQTWYDRMTERSIAGAP